VYVYVRESKKKRWGGMCVTCVVCVYVCMCVRRGVGIDVCSHGGTEGGAMCVCVCVCNCTR
jgi:hypothetical protein